MDTKAILFTLLHSLWIGGLLALLACIIIALTKKSGSALRYNLLTLSLLTFLLSVSYVFYSQISHKNVEILSSHDNINGKNGLFGIYSTQLLTGEKMADANFSSMGNIIEYFNTYSSFIVFIWFLIICIKSFLLMAGLRNIYRLKTSGIFSSGSHWESWVYDTAKELGIRKKVALFQSAIAKTPMVIGYLKPVILVPVGILNGLAPDEVESILLHELAHIKRRDYLVNILQSVMEVIFFFNPAILWISKLIRIERENCCDDIAIKSIKNKKDYVKALISCIEFGSPSSSFAMAFSHEKNHLLNRVNRIIINQNQTLNLLDRAILAVIIVFTVTASIVALSSEHNSNPDSDQFAIANTFPQSNSSEVWKSESGVLSSIENDGMLIQPQSEAQKQKKQFIFTGITAERLDESQGKLAEKHILQIMKDLIGDGLIKENENLSYLLSNAEFTINGTKQPDSVHDKYKKNYLLYDDWTICYNYKLKIN